MLTRLTVRNFKRFEEVVIDLDSPVLFIGPNNSGKTTALQALALWELGVRRWCEKRLGAETSAKRSGVALGHHDVVAVPVPDGRHLWRNLRVRNGGRSASPNVRMEIIVEGTGDHGAWTAGLEFDYANEEFFYCRPLRLNSNGDERMEIPAHLETMRVAYLSPMSGLMMNEVQLQRGAVSVRIGEGRTAEVLRNLCYRVLEEQPEEWQRLVARVEKSFGLRLDEPYYIPGRGEVWMSYEEHGVKLDLIAAGRGLQQTMLLLAHLALHPGAVLLLDEPDAHLEVLRQKEIYDLLTEVARETDSQIIVASHSEVLVRHAAERRDEIISFAGKPQRLGTERAQLLKSLREIGYADFEQARTSGFVLYVEGTTDFSVLRAFAERIGHREAVRVLDAAFVSPVGNQPMQAVSHFEGLRHAVRGLRAFALFDRLEKGLPDEMGRLPAATWKRREIENYLASDGALLGWAEAEKPPPGSPTLFLNGKTERRDAMSKAIEQIRGAAKKLRRGLDVTSPDAKVSDDFLEPVFGEYYELLGEWNRMSKKHFHELAAHIPDTGLDPEIAEKLDQIVAAAPPATESEEAGG